MDRYIGLDAHVASCTLAIMSSTGKQLRDFPVETNGAALVAAIGAIPGRRHLIFEEGLQSAWLYETLHHHVDEIVVTSVTTSPGSKNDARDAYGLAERLRTNTVAKRVFKAPAQFAVLRELARVHSMLVRDVVRVQVRLKAIYQSRGIPTPGTALYGPQRRSEWEKRLPAAARRATSKLYAQYDALVELKTEAEAELIAESKRHRITRILKTAPGLGPIRVARLLPVVVTPHRFRTKRQFWSYCGTPWNRDGTGLMNSRMRHVRIIQELMGHKTLTMTSGTRPAAADLVEVPSTHATGVESLGGSERRRHPGSNLHVGSISRTCYTTLVMSEVIFLVEEADEGGFTARGLGVSIFTEAESLPELHDRVRDAVRCHFDEGAAPQMIRLHFVRDEVISA